MEKREFQFKSVSYGTETVRLAADVHFGPAQEANKARPIAMLFHSGGFVVGSKEEIAIEQVKLLLDFGFVVVVPNYRLCPTISAVDGPLQDCLDCYEWARTDLPALLLSSVGVEIDARKIVTLGSSCGGTLAHLMTKSSHPPAAILDIAGMKYLDDPVWASGQLGPSLSSLPDFEQSLLDQIWEENPPPIEVPPPYHADVIDFSVPRTAWMFNAGAKGTHYTSIVPNGDTSLIDPAKLFSGMTSYPPTCFLHGTKDTLVDVGLAKRAYQEMIRAGHEARLILVDGADHGFDENAKPGEAEFEKVKAALEFLKKHVQ